VGARVVVRSGALSQIKEIHAGSSHNSSNDPRLLYGLGTATSVDRVEIRWPLGRVQVLNDPPIDRYHTVREPESAAR
ncbi:MAG TPA: ASPIC/UnbV domain-containing protein, partial [Candidatus Polarisedimenticolia bacterium]|nr:ASPIC/UnbV domain-containing protein [Candidatus Polarisedimenticolia bacterium]